jgi:glycopeptide antibiotics resistance protein
MFFRKNIPAFLWALLIFILCATPGRAIPHVSWLELLSFDKFVHASIFFVLQLLLMRGFLLQKSFPFIQKHFLFIPLLISVMYGGILELMQYYFFSERSGDIFDFIANSFGCLMGALLFSFLKKKIRFLAS